MWISLVKDFHTRFTGVLIIATLDSVTVSLEISIVPLFGYSITVFLIFALVAVYEGSVFFVIGLLSADVQCVCTVQPFSGSPDVAVTDQDIMYYMYIERYRPI